MQLPVTQAGRIDVPTDSPRWLIDQLWTDQAVGIIGGMPKCCKSWFGLDMALSVATSTPCLGHFEVQHAGRALVYLAEDALAQVRDRIASLCHSRQLDIETVDLHVITAPALRLDVDTDQQRLLATVAHHRPALLVLDPLVRLHRSDENSSAEISALLGFLRELQRTHGTAVALVHHMSKKRRAALGQALRGSSDIHAWSDSSAYLVRHRDGLCLTLEHRAAQSPEPMPLELVDADGHPHLRVTARVDGSAPALGTTTPLTERARLLIAAGDRPITRAALRQKLRVNNARLGEALTNLERLGAVERTPAGWRVASASPRAPQQTTLP